MHTVFSDDRAKWMFTERKKIPFPNVTSQKLPVVLCADAFVNVEHGVQ